MRWLSASIGAVVPPRPDCWHSQPTPTMGGVAIAGATLVAFLVGLLQLGAVDFAAPWAPVLLASLAMCCVGIMDDRLQLSPLAKLVASLAIGAFLVFLLAGAAPAGAMPFADTLIATVWFAGMCHAMNLLDNMDGLAAGVALIAAVFLAALLAAPLGPGLVMLLVVLAGALAGFLFWNRPPARLFMGDCGQPVHRRAPRRRVARAGRADADRLRQPGGAGGADPRRAAVRHRLRAGAAAAGRAQGVEGGHRSRLPPPGVARLLRAQRGAHPLSLRPRRRRGRLGAGGTPRGVEPMALVAVFAVLLGLVGIYLARVPAYNAEDFVALQKSSFAPFLKDLAFKWHAGQVLLDLVLITVCYYGAYRLRFEAPSSTRSCRSSPRRCRWCSAASLPALYASGLYQRSWETFGLRDLAAVVARRRARLAARARGWPR